jgi:hypothetical protein
MAKAGHRKYGLIFGGYPSPLKIKVPKVIKTYPVDHELVGVYWGGPKSYIIIAVSKSRVAMKLHIVMTDKALDKTL